MRYRNRADAGRSLVPLLRSYAGRPDVVVLALPRGGVPVALEIARELDLPLDVLVVRKLGVPWHPELAMGAVAGGGIRVTNEAVVNATAITQEQLDAVTAVELREVERREAAYRGERAALTLRGTTVILVDDGIATGSTIRAAILALKQMEVARIVVAVPVAPPSAVNLLRSEVDEVICPTVPLYFFAIGQFYDDFSQTDDERVRECLEATRAQPRAAKATARPEAPRAAPRDKRGTE